MQNLLDQKTALENQGVKFNNFTSTINHLGRAQEISLLEVILPQGRAPHSVETARNFFLPLYNEGIIAAAKAAIEGEILAEEKARKEAEEKAAAELAAAQKAVKEAEEKAAAELAAAQKAAKEAEEKAAAELAAAQKAVKEAEEKAAAELAAATGSRYAKTTKVVAWAAMLLLLFMSSVSTGMNFHNVTVLYGAIFHPAIIFVFALVLGFMPVLFAWVKDKWKVEASTVILPIDYMVTVLLFVFLNPASPLVQNWGWLAENLHWVTLGFALTGVGFYAYQVYLIYNKLLAIIADDKYKDFFMSLFK